MFVMSDKELDIDEIIQELKDENPDAVKDKDEFPTDDSPLKYFCKECKVFIEFDMPDKPAPKGKKKKKKFRKRCPHCKKEQIAMGTERSLMNYYEHKMIEDDHQAD